MKKKKNKELSEEVDTCNRLIHFVNKKREREENREKYTSEII